jgi:hypothetical protein
MMMDAAAINMKVLPISGHGTHATVARGIEDAPTNGALGKDSKCYYMAGARKLNRSFDTEIGVDNCRSSYIIEGLVFWCWESIWKAATFLIVCAYIP